MEKSNPIFQPEEIELHYTEHNETAVHVVLDKDNLPSITKEDSVKTPVYTKKKLFWNRKERTEKVKKEKTIPLYKLFRYATWFDLVLIIISVLFSIAHGAALPGAMYVFGDLTNLFVNHDISRQVFDNFTATVSQSYSFIMFDDNGTIDNLQEAIQMGSINPDLITTQENLTATGLIFTNFTIPYEEFNNVSCVIYNYAIEEDLTIYDALKLIRDGERKIKPSDAGCDCIRLFLESFGTQARCLTDDTFLFGEGGVDGILWMIYLFLMITAGVFIAAYIQISFMQTACERQVQKMRLLYYRSVLRQDIGWFDVNPSGEVSSRLNDDINKIHDGIGDKLAILIQWISTFFAGFAIGFARDWRLTLFLIGVTPFLAAVAAIFSKVVATFSSQEQKFYASAGAIAEEVLQAVRTVIAFGGEHIEANRYKEQLSTARRVGVFKGLSVGISLGVVYFVMFVTYALGFWFGGFLIQEQIIQAGDMLAVFFAVIIGAFALGQAAPNIESVLTAAGAAGEIFYTIDRVPPIDSGSDEGLIPDKLTPSIKFQDICFSYPARPDIQVMKGLNLEVNVGQTVALVGPSGCGKSTVIQLLQRFYNPSGGQILLDGNNISYLNLKWLRSNIGVVSQEPVLFDTTIAENIRYGREEATMGDIKKAAKAANAFSFISELPNGFNTNVGERGTQLSGGQKQRIAIARALVRDPKILLLDEATSALDAESENIVQEALDKAREGRTTIVIAHRLSTIQSADVIAGIEDGCVVEMGSHSELMDKEGLYYELVNAQMHIDMESDVQTVKPRLKKMVSYHKRHVTASTSQSVTKQELPRQLSIKTTDDNVETGLSEKDINKLQEEWDKDIPQVGLLRVMKANAKEWWIILFGILGAFILGTMFPLFAVIFGEVLNVFAKPVDTILNSLHPFAALFIALGVISGIAMFLKSFCFAIAGEKLTARLRFWLFKAILRQEIAWFDSERNSSGILATRLAQDASQVQGATGTRLGTLIEAGFGLILSVIIAFVYAWMLSLVLFLLIPLMLLAGLLQLKAITGHASDNNKALEQAGKVAVDSMENIRTVSSLGIEPMFCTLYDQSVKQPYKRSLINTLVYGATYGFSQGVLYFGIAATFGFGAYQVIQDSDHIAHEDFTDIFVALMAIVFGTFDIGQSSSYAPNYAKAKQSANRIYALLDREPEIDGYSEDGLKPDKYESQIKVENIEFHYPSRPEAEVLKGLSVSIQPGKTLALVGPSGCGKSTVVSLLERFYDIQSGSLKLHDNDVRDLNISWLRSQIGIVSQEPVLFDRSVADNIRYGANFRDVSDEEVIEAAKAANIHNFIQSLPEGYSTNVGSKGTQMSGGQKQRIAIARALVRDPKILLLDEATSALDTESEKIVQEALDKAREGRTTIIIAHRLSTIYNADCIAVISKGKVVEQGTHSELLAAKGIYYRLNQYQLKEVNEQRSESVGPMIEEHILTKKEDDGKFHRAGALEDGGDTPEDIGETSAVQEDDIERGETPAVLEDSEEPPEDNGGETTAVIEDDQIPPEDDGEIIEDGGELSVDGGGETQEEPGNKEIEEP